MEEEKKEVDIQAMEAEKDVFWPDGSVGWFPS
jgi:hypothetical protein